MTDLIDTKTEDAREAGKFADYLAIARLDHSTKHIFIVPGAILAFMMAQAHNADIPKHIVLGIICAVSIASANYVINEWLDREFDKFHPTKSTRSAVRRELDPKVVVCEWLALIAIGLASAFMASKSMLAAAVFFGLQGVLYNVNPWRTKDKPYLDVISESVNNPLRLWIGWAMIDASTLPPSSIVLAYWFGGAFLMAGKRFSEYREIVAANGRDMLVRSRASFRGYTDVSLNVSCFVYGLLSSFFLAVFLVKYRIEYLLLMPLIVVLFAQYLALAMEAGSSAQRPEKLVRERGLILTVAGIVVAFAIASTTDLPVLSIFVGQKLINLP